MPSLLPFFHKRSDTPLIYRGVPCWFIKVESLTEQLLANQEQTYWVPPRISKRFFLFLFFLFLFLFLFFFFFFLFLFFLFSFFFFLFSFFFFLFSFFFFLFFFFLFSFFFFLFSFFFFLFSFLTKIIPPPPPPPPLLQQKVCQLAQRCRRLGCFPQPILGYPPPIVGVRRFH